MKHKSYISAAVAAGILAFAGGAMAATGTSDAATSMDGISAAFADVLGGSGGALIATIAVIFGAVTFFLRPNIQVLGGMMVTGGLIGYGVPALTGFGSVTASIPAFLPPSAATLAALPPIF